MKFAIIVGISLDSHFHLKIDMKIVKVKKKKNKYFRIKLQKVG